MARKVELYLEKVITTPNVNNVIVLVEDIRLRQVDAAGDCSELKQSRTEREST